MGLNKRLEEECIYSASRGMYSQTGAWEPGIWPRKQERWWAWKGRDENHHHFLQEKTCGRKTISLGTGNSRGFIYEKYYRRVVPTYQQWDHSYWIILKMILYFCLDLCPVDICYSRISSDQIGNCVRVIARWNLNRFRCTERNSLFLQQCILWLISDALIYCDKHRFLNAAVDVWEFITFHENNLELFNSFHSRILKLIKHFTQTQRLITVDLD